VVRRYLDSSKTPKKHLESAHSVFLAILARGDLLHAEILPYLSQVYSVTSLSTLSPNVF
jgi:hypothetical protein